MGCAAPEPKNNISIIPYFLAGTSKRLYKKHIIGIFGRAGVDAKISFSTALNLDLTVRLIFRRLKLTSS
jgi:hypothetical protein